jgi:hypothetical protein
MAYFDFSYPVNLYKNPNHGNLFTGVFNAAKPMQYNDEQYPLFYKFDFALLNFLIARLLYYKNQQNDKRSKEQFPQSSPVNQ